MEYLDFSSVITIIRKYINDERTVVDRNLNEQVKIDQIHLLDQVFASFCDDADSFDFTFDNGQVCRWFNGQARISPRIISFYMEENRELLSADIEYNVLPLMYDIVKRNIGISIGKRALCEADAAPAGTAGQGCISAKLPAMSTQSVQGFPFWKPLFMR